MEVVVTKTVKADEEGTLQFVPVDQLGNPAQVDGGLKDFTVEGGAAEFALDPNDATGLTVIVKSDLTQPASYPLTSVIRAKLDADLGEGVKPIDVTITVVTVAAEAVTAGVNDLGNRPRTAN